MMTPLCPTKHTGLDRNRHARRRRGSRAPTLFSGTIFRLRPRLEVMEDRTLLSGFLVSNTSGSGPGSLRQAILASNNAVGATNTIDFDISGTGVQTIFPLSPLPAITNPVLIDGFSQSGYSGTPLIEINGSQTGGGDGLTITGSDVTVRGLDINGFSQGAGILISGSGATGNVIAANDIGTDPTGSQALPNYFGVRLLGGAHGNLVGGSTAAAGNLITDNLGLGVTVEGDTSVGNQITADRIFANDATSTPPLSEMLQFDGSSYVRLPQDLFDGSIYAPPQQDLSGATIEAWFQTTQGGVIIGSQSGGGYGGEGVLPFTNTPVGSSTVLYVGSDGKLYSIIAARRYPASFSWDEAVNDGRWHQVALVVDNQGDGTLYLDGSPVSSLSNVNDFFSDVDSDQVGTGYTGPSDPATPGGWYGFQGQIGAVQIWNVARSADEVQQDQSTVQTGVDPGLEADYPIDEGQGLTAHDQSPNHLDGTLAGSNGDLPTWSSSRGLAIDLGDDGMTRNSTSPRQGPNNLQNFPIIVAMSDGPLQGWLEGSLPDTPFRIDLFASAAYGPDGVGEAEDYLGSLDVTTDDQGQAVFDVPFTLPAGLPVVTATATDPEGNTSEVSVGRTASLVAPTQTVRVVPGQPLIFSAGSGDAVAIQDPAAGPLDPAWNLTLSVTAGSLTLSRIVGLTGAGEGTGSLSYSGPLSDIDVALDGMRYSPSPGFHGNATLSLEAQSEGTTPVQAMVLITNGVFVVTTTADGGPGSLRQAILDSDAATGGTNTIDFAIAGPGVQTIAPASPLPAITQPVLIDGSSQPGYSGTPLIAIDTSTSGMADALTITGSDVTLRGLADGGFALGTSSLADVLTLQSGSPRPGPSGENDLYRIDVPASSRLVADLQPQGLTTQLSLLDAQGQALVQSEGLSSGNPEDEIDQQLAAGTYFLRAQSTGGVGDFVLTATLTPASPPFQAIPVGSPQYYNNGYDPLVVGDFNGDGIPDLATMDGVHLGVGDGTFRQPVASLGLSAENPNLISMVSGDFNGDGKLDLAVENTGGGSIAVLLGDGDGTLHPPKFYAVGTTDYGPSGLPPAESVLVVGDFGNGHLDLAVANYADNDVSVLLGNGDGTFQPQVTYAVGTGPWALVAGDFTGNGRLDLAVADAGNENPHLGATGPGGVSVLLGNGDGTFQPAKEYLAGNTPVALVAGDFNGDGRLDLAVDDDGSALDPAGGVAVLLGNGDGTFQPPVTSLGVTNPSLILAGDFNGDGKLDLAATNNNTFNSGLSALLGNGNGTFQASQAISTAVE